jgi:hypothetical protein
MVIVASALVVVVIVTVLICGFVIVRRIVRWAGATGPAQMRLEPGEPGPAPFGSLPTLAEPVGQLGRPAPDADITSNASEPNDIYGG